MMEAADELLTAAEMLISSRKSDVKKWNQERGGLSVADMSSLLLSFLEWGWGDEEMKELRSFVQVLLSVSNTPAPPAGDSG